jgi:Recombinase
MSKNPFTGVTNEARQAGADKRAADLVPIVEELHAAGVTSLRAIAAALDERGIPTAAGGRWHHSEVRRLLARLAE